MIIVIASPPCSTANIVTLSEAITVLVSAASYTSTSICFGLEKLLDGILKVATALVPIEPAVPSNVNLYLALVKFCAAAVSVIFPVGSGLAPSPSYATA